MGLTGSTFIYMGSFWPCSIQGHFEVIRCTCGFSENTISTKHYFYKSQSKFIKLLLNYLLNGPHKTACGIFDILKTENLPFLSFSLTWYMGVKISKRYSSHKSQPKVFKLFSTPPPPMVITKLRLQF